MAVKIKEASLVTLGPLLAKVHRDATWRKYGLKPTYLSAFVERGNHAKQRGYGYPPGNVPISLGP